MDPLIDQTIETFWATIPPIWHQVRAHIAHKARERFGLTHDQVHVLRRIRQGRTTVSDLAEAKHISRPAASRAVDALVERGLVSRLRDSDDRRQVTLTLTPEGETALRDIFAEVSQWMAGRLAVLDPQELEQLDESMHVFRKAFP